MDGLYCIRCKHYVSAPRLSDADKAHLHEVYRQKGFAHAANVLYRQHGYPLGDAKLLCMHLTNQPGRCNRCSYAQMPAGESICPQCKAVNLSW